MAYKITSRLSTWVQIDGVTLQSGESLVTPYICAEIRRLEQLGAVTIDETFIAGTTVDYDPPAAPKSAKSEKSTVSE